MKGLYESIGPSDMLAYLVMMAIRLVELHKVLKPTGSLYLHCDPTASHYLKIILDTIFDVSNFRNEIIWHYRKWSAGWQQFQRNHDVIFFYSKSKSKKRIFNKMYMERAESTKKRFGTKKIISGYDEKGKRIPSQTEDIDSEGVAMDDVWKINRVAPVNQLFPTQKPEALLERIIKASSDKDDVVLDPFCGCGTAVMVSESLDRNWIGIDITHLAIGLIEYRMKDAFGIRPEVEGIPTTIESAWDLARRDKFQFEAWAVTRIDGVRPNQKKGRDKGIDGRGWIICGLDAKGDPKYEQVIVSVKATKKLNPGMVRDLKGTVEREKAGFGIFMCITKPTPGVKIEAETCDVFETPLGTRYPKIQIYTISDYFNDVKPNLPSRADVYKIPQSKTEPDGKQVTL